MCFPSEYREHLPDESEGTIIEQAAFRVESPEVRKVDSLSRFIQTGASLQRKPLAVFYFFYLFNVSPVRVRPILLPKKHQAFL